MLLKTPSIAPQATSDTLFSTNVSMQDTQKQAIKPCRCLVPSNTLTVSQKKKSGAIAYLSHTNPPVMSCPKPCASKYSRNHMCGREEEFSHSNLDQRL